MSDYTISYQGPGAKAVGRALAISPKHSQEICRMLRGMPYAHAKKTLERVLLMEQAVPFKSHYHNLGHRRGKIGPGRYPLLATKEILAIINSAAANAQHQGMSIANLRITHIIAQQGPKVRRRLGHKAKRTHIEVVLKEGLRPKNLPVKPTKELTHITGASP
ncbi:50S ribosomal protein L22 [Candidatus Woesearchaeota archaeon]|nr:50S ribosomal protein L22 [Candidatus Woesearchaeota archaeon]